MGRSPTSGRREYRLWQQPGLVQGQQGDDVRTRRLVPVPRVGHALAAVLAVLGIEDDSVCRQLARVRGVRQHPFHDVAAQALAEVAGRIPEQVAGGFLVPGALDVAATR